MERVVIDTYSDDVVQFDGDVDYVHDDTNLLDHPLYKFDNGVGFRASTGAIATTELPPGCQIGDQMKGGGVEVLCEEEFGSLWERKQR